MPMTQVPDIAFIKTGGKYIQQIGSNLQTRFYYHEAGAAQWIIVVCMDERSLKVGMSDVWPISLLQLVDIHFILGPKRGRRSNIATPHALYYVQPYNTLYVAVDKVPLLPDQLRKATNDKLLKLQSLKKNEVCIHE